jgi:hypothetical protein
MAVRSDGMCDYEEFLLLLAYRPGRNKIQAQKAIEYTTGKQLHMGRHILPSTQILCDQGLIESISKDLASAKFLR